MESIGWVCLGVIPILVSPSNQQVSCMYALFGESSFG